MTRLPDPRERPWLTVAEVAQITGEGEKVIRAALAAGQLPILRLGRYVRIPTHLLMLQLGMDTPDNNGAEPDQDSATATHDQDFGDPSNDQSTAQPLRLA